MAIQEHVLASYVVANLLDILEAMCYIFQLQEVAMYHYHQHCT
jgi:hypothetical protein